MRDGLLWLMDSVIDYAGLFPPARLEMKPALAEYLRHAASEDSWIVDRFICPAARLPELREEILNQNPEQPFGISVIGTSCAEVQKDREAIEWFKGNVDPAFMIDAYEVRSTGDVAADAKALAPLRDLDVHLEVPLDDQLTNRLHAIAEHEWLKAKARTGGLTQDAFPSCESLAMFLQECSNLDLEYKLTAGLHHPIRHLDPDTGGMMHGFLNVLIAAALIEPADLNRIEIVEVLEDQNQDNFHVEDGRVGWKDLTAEYQDVQNMRMLFIGYGSCSIDEPLEGLRNLGILEESR